MKKFYLVVVLLLVAAIALPTVSGTAKAQDAKFRVAVVMPSTGTDLAFSQSMVDALKAIQEERGADAFEYAVSENLFVVDDAAAAIRDYATQGYNLVIAHGSQYGSSLAEIAPDFPKTSFAWGTTVDTFTEQGINNVYAYEARSEEGGFVLGAMAAMLTESDVIGIVGPIETGDAKLYVDGFKAGIAYEDDAEAIDVLVNYIGSFSDLAKAAEAADSMITEKADVLTGTAQMVPGAIEKAQAAGALWFGTQADQASLAPDIVVACQVYDWTVALNPIIDQVMEGKLGGESFSLTLENEGLVIEFNEDYELDEDVQAEGEAVMQAIIDGDISFEVAEDGTLNVIEAGSEAETPTETTEPTATPAS